MGPNRKSWSRQKSFFDQETKARPKWQDKHRQQHNATRQSENSVRPTLVLSPIAASSEAKCKLAAFCFQQENDEMPLLNSQTLEIVDDKKESMGKDGQENDIAERMTPRHQSLSQKSLNNDLRDCPQTPIGRIPLAELIAESEDLNPEILNLTPVERVVWGHSQHSVENNDENGMSASRRGKKRAYSSSPASSSQNEAPYHFPKDKPSFDLQNLQNTLKTPQADPANDLWNRYSLNSMERLSPSEVAKPAFTDFLNSSSPQTPAQPMKRRVKDCRQRSYSCNFEWPTSVAKRRKLHYSSSNQETSTSPAVSKTNHDENGKSKLARVSLLLEEIQGRLIRPTASKDKRNEADSNSGQTVNQKHVSPESPSRQSVNSMLGRTKHGDRKQAQCLRPSTTQMSAFEDPELQKAESSFDFNDEDEELDVELIRAVDKAGEVGSSVPFSATAPVLLHSTRQRGIVHDTKLDSNKPNDGPIHDKRKKPLKMMSPRKSGSFTSSAPLRDIGTLHSPSSTFMKFDEFDEDNDVSAADLEDFMAIYDTQPLNRTQDVPNDRKSRSPDKRRLQSPRTKVTSIEEQQINDSMEHEVLSDDDDDEFGGALDFEKIIAQCEEATQKNLLSNSPNVQRTLVIQRYLILTITEGSSEDGRGCRRHEKVLLVQDEKTKVKKAITLRGAWIESPCSPGSYVHLVGQFNHYGQCVVDDIQNLLILHPDHLISATVVADSFLCSRRAVLQDRVKATSQLSESTIYGSMLHEIFQEAMKVNKWDTEWLTIIIEKIATRNLESLYELNITFENAVDHLLGKAVEIQSWADVFVAARPKANAIIKDRNGTQALMSINKLLDVEEKVWSPAYGLKGMVDATVQVVMKDGFNDRTLTVPFEIKTGKFPNAAHKAQTALYTLLLSDRYDVDIIYGILYYTETSEISRIPAVRHELIHMVMQRNELASYVRQRLELPPMLKNPHLCGKCYAQTACFLYHKLSENGDEKTSGMGETFKDLVKHLNPQHRAFFRKWDDLITKEEKESLKFRRELWTMQSTEREKLGRCFANVVIDPSGTYELEDAPKINRFHYAFIKERMVPGFSFMESQLVIGEPVVISDEKGHFALANGYITNVRKRTIHVAVDRRLNNSRIREKDFDPKQNQVFTGIMEVVQDRVGQTTPTAVEAEVKVSYRVDKDEFSNGMATVRNNLLCLMEKNVFGVQALRKLIVEAAPPTFKPNSTPYVLSCSASQTSLNADQKNAIEKVMSAKDYALVLGMPGTGKTTTIAHIIRALTAQGKSILLTSYTHTAVDNILLKIRNDNIGIFRVGALAKIHPEVQEFADLASVPMKTEEEIKNAYSRQIVATTCLGINHPVFNQRIFDYCIVDEASQITLPVCLGPIRMARTFVLVGDHFQLPPLVQNKEALEGGLDVSLFKLLSETHASSVVNLEHQYRMCADIMSLSNTLIYDGRLKCGTPEVANRILTIPNMSALSRHHPTMENLRSISSKNSCLNPRRGSCWIRDLLDPSVKACLINTDPLLAISREAESGSRIVNHCEATLCTQLVDSLITTGVPPATIGVITLYRSQLALLKQNLHHQHSAVEMHTADKFQGRDKEVILLSLVRSNDGRKVGDLLKDWRRVNVAFTRARSKLLILGSKSTIASNELLNKFVRLMARNRWVYDLPPGAMDSHVWDEQVATTTAAAVVAAQHPPMNSLDPNANAETKTGPRGKENAGARAGGRKRPAKTGRVDAWAMMQRKPVLRDILNDAS